jgi:hypothetical protein
MIARLTWGWEAPENNEEACSAVGWLGGGQRTVVNGNLLAEEEAAGDGALTGFGWRVELGGVATPSTEDGCDVPWIGRRQRWMGWCLVAC